MRVMVLGCGPAGLMAVHAAAGLGHDVVVVSKKRKSEMYGAQYLHKEIPGIDCGKPELIHYRLEGSITGYREKVYGSNYRGTVSPDELEESHWGWNIRAAYDDLWDTYGRFVIDREFQCPEDIDELLRKGRHGADLVVSSLPAPLLCTTPEHTFAVQEIYAIGDAPERGVVNPIKVPPGTIVCNGEPDVGWYRTANVFGRSTTEWPLKRKPPVTGVALVNKPIATNCTCWPDVRRVGRYGQWTKGVLAHTAYYETFDLLDGQGIQEALF